MSDFHNEAPHPDAAQHRRWIATRVLANRHAYWLRPRAAPSSVLDRPGHTVIVKGALGSRLVLRRARKELDQQSPDPMPAPASEYSASGCPDPSPAPGSTATSTSLPLSERTASGVSATEVVAIALVVAASAGALGAAQAPAPVEA